VRLDKRDVLEVGCGDGRLTFQYASRARSVVALDPNDEQIQRATMRARALQLEHVRFVVGTAQRPPNGRFDVALFTWSL
jgi:ubiquinone/menaquinone biosynthesis C-methylase UbiE